MLVKMMIRITISCQRHLPRRQVREIAIGRVAMEMGEAAPVLHHHEVGKSNVETRVQQSEVGGAGKLGQHARHGGRHRQPFVRLP
jgi:hypothetical protein